MESVNNANLSWKAKSYAQTTTDGQSGDRNVMNLAQTKAVKSFDDGSAEFKEALSEAQKYLHVPHEEIDFQELP